ncbi:MAG: NAD(P)-dependent oxidoreductase [Chitinophagaceae bacterium]|jgi:D-3-phosphoglycerate dehydrogenase
MTSLSHLGKVFITGHAHPVLASRLSNAGYTVVNDPTISREALMDCIHEATGLILTTRITADKELLEKGMQLKWIGRLGSGMELIDTEFAKSIGIACYSSPEGNRLAVAEHALGMLLSLLHRISSSHQEVQKSIWLREENRGVELSGKTVGIIGYGNTGSEFARLLAPFQVKVLANDIVKKDFAQPYVFAAEIAQIKAEADIISFHLPQTELTLELANQSFFQGLKKSPILINTSRGKVVDIPALLEALENGYISGAALDVLPNEKLNTYTALEKEWFNNLRLNPRVLLTPHIAGYSQESFLRMSTVLLKKLGLES